MIGGPAHPAQWSLAEEAPMPVWLRTVRAVNASRSCSASLLRSVTENSQIAMNASGIEMMPGLGNGVIGDANPNTSTHTVWLSSTHTVATTSPVKPPMVAPRVVQPRQEID